jgi:hypothetical protein
MKHLHFSPVSKRLLLSVSAVLLSFLIVAPSFAAVPTSVERKTSRPTTLQGGRNVRRHIKRHMKNVKKRGKKAGISICRGHTNLQTPV